MPRTIKQPSRAATQELQVAKRAAITAVDQLARALQGKSHTLATYRHVFCIAHILRARWLA
jgi:hypothetical protein